MPGIGDLAKSAMEKLNAGVTDDKKKTRVTNEVAGALFDSLVETVMKGEVVSIQGLGNFRVQDRKATKARNPQTGVQFDVPESKRLKFTASKTLKERLNGQPHKKASPKKPKAAKPAAPAPTPAAPSA